MTKEQTNTDWHNAYNKYCFNLFRHLTFIGQYMHQQFMNKLEGYGYKGLGANFIRVIPHIGKDGVHAVDLARDQQMPKQTMGKLVNDICEKKLIVKKSDPNDSRAQRLFITQKGIVLIKDALKVTGEIEKTLKEMTGDEAFDDFKTHVGLAYNAMGLSYPAMNQHINVVRQRKQGGLLLHLYGMARHVDIELYQCNIKQGFDDVRNSYRTILGNISEDGTRIADIVKASEMTKQSVSLLAAKTIESGYVKKIPDPSDKRAQKLVFSSKGIKLIINSMNNLTKIERQLSDKIGNKTFNKLQFEAACLWQCLGGISPELMSDKTSDLNADNLVIEDWIRVLYLALREESRIALGRYFRHSKQGVYLTPRFTQQLLHKSPIKITKKDEKRLGKWLKKVIDLK